MRKSRPMPTQSHARSWFVHALALSVIGAAGCSDASGEWTRVRSTGEVGVPDEQVLVVADTTFVCPHLVPISNRQFDLQEIREGKVFHQNPKEGGHFGPFVPCGTPVTEDSGFCPSCNQPYHLPGRQPMMLGVTMQAPELALRVSPNGYINAGGRKVFPNGVQGVPYVHGLAAEGGATNEDSELRDKRNLLQKLVDIGRITSDEMSEVTDVVIDSDRWTVSGSMPPGLELIDPNQWNRLSDEALAYCASRPASVNIQRNYSALVTENITDDFRFQFRSRKTVYLRYVIGGIPTQSGNYNFRLSIQDGEGNRAEEAFVLNVLTLDADDGLSTAQRVPSIGEQEPLLSDETSTIAVDTNDSEGWPSPEALVQFQCPYDNAVLDPVAWQVNGGDARTSQRFGPGHCPSCQRFFECLPSDVAVVLDHHQQLLDSAGKPIDPFLHASSGPNVTEGTVRLVDDFVGACWRCGGIKLCPECDGAGVGNSGIYGEVPVDCWYCGETGRCPDCDYQGFSTYTGGLPASYKIYANKAEETEWFESGERDRKWEPQGAPEADQPSQ
jgi:hypothetical protein